MARFTAAWRTAGAGSTTLPIGSLYATAAVRPKLVEVGIFNTTATAVSLKICRLTTTGTQGSTITAFAEDDPSQGAVGVAKDTHTVAPTLGGVLRTVSLGAAIGSGVIYTLGSGKTAGVIVASATGNATTDGIGIIPLTGTGQICDVYFTWDE
jgi:hypothetical protein